MKFLVLLISTVVVIGLWTTAQASETVRANTTRSSVDHTSYLPRESHCGGGQTSDSDNKKYEACLDWQREREQSDVTLANNKCENSSDKYCIDKAFRKYSEDRRSFETECGGYDSMTANKAKFVKCVSSKTSVASVSLSGRASLPSRASLPTRASLRRRVVQ